MSVLDCKKNLKTNHQTPVKTDCYDRIALTAAEYEKLYVWHI